jgi:predicted peptidase
MKNILMLGIIAFVIACGFLYSYRQKMYRVHTDQGRMKMVERSEAKYIDLGQSEQLPYRLFSPDPVNSSGRMPLIVYLHGAGGRGNNNINQLENVVQFVTSDGFQQEFRSFVLVPQCPGGHEWVDIKDPSGPLKNYNQDDIPETIYLKAVIKIIDKMVAADQVDPKRLYIMGFSMGATGTWDFITRHPEKFAAAVIFNGRSDPSKAQRISRLPLWVFHGKFDKISPITNPRPMIEQLRKFDSKVIYKELFRGHGIPGIAIKERNLFPWLFSQRKSL